MAWYNPSDPKQRNALFATIGILLLLYPFYSFWYSPEREQVTSMQGRLETLEDQNRRAQVIAARGGADLEERMALYERHVSKLEELIPEAEEVAGLVDDISQQARTSRVALNRIIPEPAEQGTFYTKTSYSMVVIGEYHAVARFLTDIASLSRIVTPVELDVTLFQNPDLFPEYESPVSASFRIETYVVPERTSQPGPAEGQGAQG